jgi:hypothetical protein
MEREQPARPCRQSCLRSIFIHLLALRRRSLLFFSAYLRVFSPRISVSLRIFSLAAENGRFQTLL